MMSATIRNRKANFTRDGHRFIVTEDNVLVYRRVGSETEYSLNAPASQDRAAYDAKRYQLKKNQREIREVQNALSASSYAPRW